MRQTKLTVEEQRAEIDRQLEEIAPRLERTAEGRKALAATRKHFKEMDEAMDRIFEEGRKKLDELFR
jgi:hypothetical protein